MATFNPSSELSQEEIDSGAYPVSVHLDGLELLRNFGILVSVKDAHQQYQKMLPRWRRIFWPWLTRLEKQRAVFLAVVEKESDG